MAGLPRKYAKMGFKRGWAAYNRLKKPKKSKSRTVKYMARRRKGGFKKRYRKSSGGLGFGGITKILIGAGLVVLYEVYLSPMIPVQGMMKNFLELGIGIFLMTGKMPMPVKAFGAALATLNAYQILSSFMPGSGVSTSGDNW